MKIQKHSSIKIVLIFNQLNHCDIFYQVYNYFSVRNLIMTSVKDTSFIPDMPSGPLDEYRKRAKFDWKQLRLVFEDENLLRLKYKTWNKIESDPLFAKPRHTLSADEQKYRAAMQMNATNLLKLAPPDVEKMSHRQKVYFVYNAIFSHCCWFFRLLNLGYNVIV